MMVKKILVWFLLVTMLIACSALCFGCGLGDDTTASETEPPVEKPAHLPDSYTQISGSALIFAPNSSPALMACVSDLFSRLNASGADVAVMESAVVPSERYIYICEVTDFESQYDFTLGLNDYCILTDDNGVVISAGGVNALKNAIAAFADGVFMGRYYYEYGTNICHFAAEPDNDKFAEILEAYHDTDGRLMTVAHRADHQNYPENSLEAIESCIAAGVDIVELDVRRTKDGKYVLMHDDTVNRTTNGSGSVSSMTLSEIQSLYLREGTGGGGAAVTDIRPPSFEEVLEVCKGKIIINLDKDANNASYFDEIYALLEKHDCVNIAQFKTSESPSVVRARFAKLEAQGKELPLYCGMIYSSDYNYTMTRIRELEGLTQMLELGFTGTDAQLLDVIKLGRECGMRSMVLTLYNADNSIIWTDWTEKDYGAYMTEHPLDLDSYIDAISDVKPSTNIHRASDFNRYSGISLVKSTALDPTVVGKAVSFDSNGDYVRIPKIEFSGSENMIYLAATAVNDCAMKVYVDSITGSNLIASVDLGKSDAAVNGLYSAELAQNVEGEHDVYLVMSAAGSASAVVDFFTFFGDDGEPAATVDAFAEGSEVGYDLPETVFCITTGGRFTEVDVEWDAAESYEVGVHTVYGKTENGVDVELTLRITEAITISSVDEWNKFAKDVNSGNDYKGKSVVLTEDLNFSGASFTIVGTSDSTPFSGVFSGGGHTIRNVIYESAGYAALFGYAREATIKDVILTGAGFTTSAGYAGGIIAYGDGVVISGCEVKNCYVKSTRTENILGGVGAVAGYVENSSRKAVLISDCSATNCSVTGMRDVGGFIGDLYSGSILRSFAYDVTVTARGNSVAGFAGNVHGGYLEDCHCKSTATSNGSNLGAFVGYCGGNPTFVNCSYDPSYTTNPAIGRLDSNSSYTGSIIAARG